MSVNLRNKQIILASNSQKRNLKKFLSGRELPYIYTSVNNKKNPNETTKYSNKKEKNNRIFLGMKNKKLKLLLSPIERVNKIKKFDNLNIPMTQRRKCISPFHSKVETTDSQKNNNVKKERRNSTVLKNSFKASSFAETQKKFDQNYFLFSNNYLFYYALLSKYNKEINDLLNKYIKDNEPSYNIILQKTKYRNSLIIYYLYVKGILKFLINYLIVKMEIFLEIQNYFLYIQN